MDKKLTIKVRDILKQIGDLDPDIDIYLLDYEDRAKKLSLLRGMLFSPTEKEGYFLLGEKFNGAD